MIAVLAGTHAEYLDWLEHQRIPREERDNYKYINGPRDYKGIRFEGFYVTGTFWYRGDSLHLEVGLRAQIRPV